MRMSWFVLLSVVSLALTGCSGCRDCKPTQNDLPVRCLDEPKPGPCKARVVRYFYDYRYDNCRAFNYGGCLGHVPFETLDACKETCVRDGG